MRTLSLTSAGRAPLERGCFRPPCTEIAAPAAWSGHTRPVVAEEEGAVEVVEVVAVEVAAAGVAAVEVVGDDDGARTRRVVCQPSCS